MADSTACILDFSSEAENCDVRSLSIINYAGLWHADKHIPERAHLDRNLEVSVIILSGVFGKAVGLWLPHVENR